MPSAAEIYATIRPPAQQDGPLDQYGKMVSLKSMIGNEQLNEMQRTKLARDMQEEESFRNLFAGATPEQMSAPDFLQKAMAASPARGISLQKSQLDQQKTQAELFKTKLETGAKALELHRDQLANVNDPQAAAAWVKAAYADPTLAPIAAHGGSVEQALSRIPTDPAAFADWKEKNSAGAAKLLELSQQKRTQAETARHNQATEGQSGATLAETKRHHGVTEQLISAPDMTDPEVQKRVNFWADVVRKGGTLPPGLARSGSGFVKAVTERAAQGDVTPEEMMSNQAQFTGEKAGQRTLGSRTANIEMAANEAASLADLAKQASGKVDRTQFKSLNDVIQAGQRATSSPELRAFTASNTSLINAYARAINPQGVGTVADKEHARDMLSTGFSKGDYQAAVDQLLLEIDAARRSPGQVKKSMREQFTGKEGSGAGASGASQETRSNAPGKPSGGIKFLGWE